MMTWGKRKKKPERVLDWDEKLAPYLGKEVTITVDSLRVVFDFGDKKVALVNKVVGKEERRFEAQKDPVTGTLVDVQIASAVQVSQPGERPVVGRCTFEASIDGESLYFSALTEHQGLVRSEGNFQFDLVEVKNG